MSTFFLFPLNNYINPVFQIKAQFNLIGMRAIRKKAKRVISLSKIRKLNLKVSNILYLLYIIDYNINAICRGKNQYFRQLRMAKE